MSVVSGFIATTEPHHFIWKKQARSWRGGEDRAFCLTVPGYGDWNSQGKPKC